MKKGVIIQGSSRSIGNTKLIASLLQENTGFDIIDLKSKNISEYNYDFKNREDDFIPLIADVTTKYNTIIFATPVYWYSMSGIMKIFLDRFTDCLKYEKEIGRRLRGKTMAAISCGSDENEVEGFFVPFSRTAEYLGMEYLGSVHTWIENSYPPEVVLNLIEGFAAKFTTDQAPAENPC